MHGIDKRIQHQDDNDDDINKAGSFHPISEIRIVRKYESGSKVYYQGGNDMGELVEDLPSDQDIIQT